MQADNAQKTEQITALTARLEAERLAREAQDQRMAEMMRVLAALGSIQVWTSRCQLQRLSFHRRLVLLQVSK